MEEKLLRIISETIADSKVVPFTNRTKLKYPKTTSRSKHLFEEISDDLNIYLIVNKIARYSIFSECSLEIFDGKVTEIQSESLIAFEELLKKLTVSTDEYLTGKKIFFEIIDPFLSIFLIFSVAISLLVGYGTDFAFSKPGGLAISIFTTSLTYLFRFYVTYDLKVASLKKVLLERINGNLEHPISTS